ncbi:hypothetical protein UPYG_G00201340 [Umbra pygmaea]|uniref:Ig-like domain-containing protein n=1 Tax=Umbra pygmaea TaxID=75934 RepID=A0ABD0X654_UMBPY
MNNLILLVLLAHVSQVVETLMDLEPRTLTVLRGDSARLTCSTTEQYVVMVWLHNGITVFTISAMHGILSNSPNWNATDCSNSQLFCWEIVLSSAQRSHQGQVTCDLQNIQRETANLFVQEMGNVAITGGNQTVIKGEDILLQCLAIGWYPGPNLTWLVNGRDVEQHQFNISIEEPVDVAGHFNLQSNLSIQAAVSSLVECLVTVSALPVPQSSRVRLTVVAEVLEETVCDSCIALIIGTASVSGVLLLMLLTLCIALCYRQWRRAKSSKQRTKRTNESKSKRSSVAEATEGKLNLGYASEGLTGAGSRDFNITQRADGQTGSISAHKIPDDVSFITFSLNTNQSNIANEPSGHGSRTVRRQTTV